MNANMIKDARSCVTASSWERFLKRYGSELQHNHDAKPLAEIFHLLKKDPQSLRYSEDLWISLLRGCLASWNLELARQISAYIAPIPSPALGLLSAEIALQGGSPAEARQIANRTLRLTKIPVWQHLQLQMAVCSSYVEEGKTTFAIRQLNKMESDLKKFDPSPSDKANILTNMARAQFFLGRYLQAADNFERSYRLFLESENWELAAKGMFNASASFHNSGPSHQNKAFDIVAECKDLSEKHGLEGTLSHCYAFFGTDHYQHGDFPRAVKFYKKALDLLPSSDNSFRRMHITSMVAFTFLKLNRRKSANKYTDITLELANLDKSERFRARYLSLKAEMLWHEGYLEESQKMLLQVVTPFLHSGVNTLEELSAVSRFLLQSAALGTVSHSPHIKIAEALKNNTTSWLEFLYARAQSKLARGEFSEALRLAERCAETAKLYGAKYYHALANLTAIQTKLATRSLDQKFEHHLNELAPLADQLTLTDIPLQFFMVKAAEAYQRGSFDKAVLLLQSTKHIVCMSKPTKFIINYWLATACGHSLRFSDPLLGQLAAQATRIFFAPTIAMIQEGRFIVSDHYTVNLEHHPIIAKMLAQLLTSPQYTASSAQLQATVWHESLSNLGWEQKVRNTVMRVRHLFPFTMAPLIIHSDHNIKLNHGTIVLAPPAIKKVTIDQEILYLLHSKPRSSRAIAGELRRSKATIKRALAKLAAANRIRGIRNGRQMTYLPVSDLNEST